MSLVKQQYERFPYPPLHPAALPCRDQGAALRYELAVGFAKQAGLRAIEPEDHRGIRILVVGAGTLEALVVAQMHPHAAEVVALDFSERALTRLKQRISWAKWRDLLTLARLRGYRLAPIRLQRGDLNSWQESEFDYILANNVLHHTDRPAAGLRHLAQMLRPGGVMRVVTYPRQSRIWIRQTAGWLRWYGLSQADTNLKRNAEAVINRLPSSHPIYNCYHSHSETVYAAGLVDAFFHACENPLSPLQWQQASEAAGLELLAEAQSEAARSSFLAELLPACAALDRWRGLQVMDDLLELTASPVWWFRKVTQARGVALPCEKRQYPEMLTGGDVVAGLVHPIDIDKVFYLPSRCYWQLGQGVRRAQSILAEIGVDLSTLLKVLEREVGPRVDRSGNDLYGLSIGEYDSHALLHAQPPPEDSQWLTLQQQLDKSAHLRYQDEVVPGNGIAQQAQWLQLRYGSEQAQIGPVTLVL